jgi:hypothetical protein
MAPEAAARLVNLAQLHGVTSLLAHRLPSRSSACPPEPLFELLRGHLRHEAARELVVEAELQRLCAALHAGGVRHLLFKGAPLAYTVYPEPYLRTRCDTDLLVAGDQRDAVDMLLRSAGYAPDEDAAGGEIASSERMYTRQLPCEVSHVVDLHWRLSNLQAFANALDFETLWAGSRPVPRLGPSARMPGFVHALLIACLHRAGHLGPTREVEGVEYTTGNRLIWLYDIHLLAIRLDGAGWDRFVSEAGAKGLRAVCLDGLRTAREHLPVSVPQDVLDALSRPGPREVTAGHLRGGRWRRHLVDLQGVRGWGERGRLLREWLFPPASYMLRKYGTHSRASLPWLYLRRVLGGIWRSRNR